MRTSIRDMEVMDLALLVSARRSADRWRNRWVWTFGFLLFAILAIVMMVAGRWS